jgi:zinc D-Ala-D-Ala carboxypeptidase
LRLDASRQVFLLILLVSSVLVPACAPRGSSLEVDIAPEHAAPSLLHPSFTMDAAALDGMLVGAPQPVASAISDDPHRFLSMLESVLGEPADLTILVDKDHPLPATYAPEDLIDLDALSGELSLSRPGHRLRDEATEALREMSAAAARDGITLTVSSPYRSYEYQVVVYERWVNELGREAADRVSARPGTSQHQLGTAVDFGCICDEFAEHAAGRWLFDHAHRFGYSLSYPDGYEHVTGYSYEPWHYRYVGRAAAALEREFFTGIQQWLLEFLHEHRTDLEDARR